MLRKGAGAKAAERGHMAFLLEIAKPRDAQSEFIFL